jgi:hypothetical protein
MLRVQRHVLRHLVNNWKTKAFYRGAGEAGDKLTLDSAIVTLNSRDFRADP